MLISELRDECGKFIYVKHFVFYIVDSWEQESVPLKFCIRCVLLHFSYPSRWVFLSEIRGRKWCPVRKAELDTKIFYVADEDCRMYHHIITVQDSVSQFLFRRRTCVRRPAAASSHGLWWAKRQRFLPSTASHSRRDGIVFVARNSACE